MPELQFRGKEFVYNHHLTVPFRPLEMHADKGIGAPRLDGNLVIHGDNLHALKALLPMYAGKVDCVFIDPPYNTGTEGWCYNDNVNSPMIREWLSQNPIQIDDRLKHDKWACMMWPRIVLLRELLADDGFLFLTIDHHETHTIRMILDEVFGEDNFRNEIIIRRGVKNVQAQFETIGSLSTGHDTLYCYSKSPATKMAKLADLSGGAEAGKWDTFWRGTDRATMRYELFGKTPETGQWRWEEARAKAAIANYQEYKNLFANSMSEDDFFHLRSNENGSKIDFLRCNDDGVVQYFVPPRDGKLLSDVWLRLRSSGSFTDFPHEKGIELIETVLRWVNKRDALVLDSFAGSGSTGHAALSLNTKDGGSRRFILIETEDYAETLTAKRITDIISEQNSDELSLRSNNFTYCTLGAPIEMDAILSGDALPTLEAMAGLLWHTATATPFAEGDMVAAAEQVGDGVFNLGQFAGRTFWLIYKPDRDWLKNADAALSLAKARAIAASAPGNHMVFAPAKFVSRELLNRERLDVDYAPLPFALYRLETA